MKRKGCDSGAFHGGCRAKMGFTTALCARWADLHASVPPTHCTQGGRRKKGGRGRRRRRRGAQCKWRRPPPNPIQSISGYKSAASASEGPIRGTRCCLVPFGDPSGSLVVSRPLRCHRGNASLICGCRLSLILIDSSTSSLVVSAAAA